MASAARVVFSSDPRAAGGLHGKAEPGSAPTSVRGVAMAALACLGPKSPSFLLDGPQLSAARPGLRLGDNEDVGLAGYLIDLITLIAPRAGTELPENSVS